MLINKYCFNIWIRKVTEICIFFQSDDEPTTRSTVPETTKSSDSLQKVRTLDLPRGFHRHETTDSSDSDLTDDFVVSDSEPVKNEQNSESESERKIPGASADVKTEVKQEIE